MAELSKENSNPSMDYMAFKNEAIKKITQLASENAALKKKSKPVSQSSGIAGSLVQKLRTLNK